MMILKEQAMNNHQKMPRNIGNRMSYQEEEDTSIFNQLGVDEI